MKKYFNTEQGIAHILLLLLFVVIVGAAAVYFILPKLGVNVPSVPGVTPADKKEANVSLQTQYQNPFDKNTQYVNPFQQYKNPFDVLKVAKK